MIYHWKAVPMTMRLLTRSCATNVSISFLTPSVSSSATQQIPSSRAWEELGHQLIKLC